MCAAKYMSRHSPQEPPVFIAPAVAAELKGWLDHLGDERNYSAKTVEAYRRDVLQF